MKKRRLCLLLLLSLLLPLAACAETKPAFPAPEALYGELEAAGLPEMLPMGAEYLEAVTGVDPASCESFVYRLPADLGPEEILLILATDDAAAEEIQQKLERRLEDRRADARRYLTEQLPVLDASLVRRDGRLVSLLITGDTEALRKVYGQYR